MSAPSLTVDELTCLAVAAPHDATRRKVLADCIDDFDPAPEAGRVSRALRDDRRGRNILRAVWQQAQDANIEPSYRLLWAVVILGTETATTAATQTQQPTSRRRSAPVTPVAPVAPQPVTPYTPPWLPGRNRPWRRSGTDRRIEPLTVGSGSVLPLTVGEDRPSPKRLARNRVARILEAAIMSGVRPPRSRDDDGSDESDNSIGGTNDYAYGC